MAVHRLIIDAAGVHKDGLRTDDIEIAERWTQEAAQNSKARGHIVDPVALHFEPMHGDVHGNDIIHSLHRLHAEVIRNSNGEIDVRALYHYPEREHDDASGPHPSNRLLTKKQWVKIPQVAARKIKLLR